MGCVNCKKVKVKLPRLARLFHGCFFPCATNTSMRSAEQKVMTGQKRRHVESSDAIGFKGEAKEQDYSSSWIVPTSLPANSLLCHAQMLIRRTGPHTQLVEALQERASKLRTIDNHWPL